MKSKSCNSLHLYNLIKTWENNTEMNLEGSDVRVWRLAIVKSVTKLLVP